MGRTQLEAAVAKLKRKIEKCENFRKKIFGYVEILKGKLSRGEISYREYGQFINKKLDGKTVHEWLYFYDSYIEHFENKIKQEYKKFKRKRVLVLSSCFLLISFLLISSFYFTSVYYDFSTRNENQEVPLEDLSPSGGGFLGDIIFSIVRSVAGILNFFYSTITGQVVEEVSENETLGNESFKNQTLENQTVIEEITETSDDILDETTLEEAEGAAEISSIVVPGDVRVVTLQYGAVLGQPVKWKKRIIPQTLGNVKINLPKGSVGIVVDKVTSQEKILDSGNKKASLEDLSPSQEEPFVSGNISRNRTAGIFGGITGEVVFTIKESTEEQGGFFTWLLDFFGRFSAGITGRTITPLEEDEIEVEIEIDEITEYEIEYETAAPYALEEEIAKGKRVTVVGPDTIHYENVLIFTNLSEELGITNPSLIKIYWREDESYLPVQSVQDLDNDGIYDYVEWVAPQLSNQTFDIIVITKAEHLDSNRDFISDIYDDVIELDGNWSGTITNRDYVRITFELNLTNESDITIYPRIITGNPRIEVYEINGTELIAEFTSITDNEYNTIFLTNLEGTQDTFDLRIVGGSVEFDHIVDPPAKVSDNSGSCTPTTIDDSGSQTTVCAFSLENSGNTFAAQCTLTITDDGTANPITNVCQSGIQFKVDSIAFDGGNAECTVNNGDGSVDCGATWASGSDSEDINWTLSGCNGDGLVSTIQLEASCNDALNNKPTVTVTGAGDTTYPQFTSPTEDPTDSPVYAFGVTYEFNITITSTNGTQWIRFANQNYTVTNLSGDVYNFTVSDLSAGTHYYNWTAYGNGSSNNANTSETYDYTITQAVPQGSLSGTTPVTYGTAGDVAGSESNLGDSDVGYNLYRNDTSSAVSTPDTTVLGVAFYEYTWNATAGTNWTTNASMDTFVLEVQQANSDVNLTLNNNDSNITITQGDTIDLNCSTITGDSGATLTMYREGSSINTGTSPLGNTTTFNTIQVENITCTYSDSQNYTTISETWWVNVTNAAPQINFTSLSIPNATTTSNASIEINVSITEESLNEVKYNWNGTNYTLFNDSLVLFMNFDNRSSLGENDTHVVDISSAGNNGTVVGGNVTTSSGKYGSAMQFDGTDDYIKVNNDTSLVIGTDKITMSVWIYPTADGQSSGSRIISKDDGTNNYQIVFRNNGGSEINTIRFHLLGTSVISDNNAVNLNEWSHVVARYNGSEMVTFVNGINIKSTSKTGTISITSGNLTIGAPEASQANRRFTGSIDDVKIYNRSLSEAEVQQLYMTSLTKYDSTTWNLYVNQSKNSTAGLDDGDYTYFASAKDESGSENSTEIRTVTIEGNAAPQINFVSLIPNTDPTEDGITYITFNFTATDSDGVSDLNNDSVRAEFLKSGETTRINTSCTSEGVDSTTNRYFCTIGMWYFDLNGAWSINVTINDSAGEVAENSSTTFTYNLLTAMKMGPTALTWPGLTITSTNLGSDTDPIIINNTGNDVITNITVTAIDLAGEVTSSEYIYAANFTVNVVDASDNTTMVNGSAIQVAVANLTRGNYSVNDGVTGQEELYFYLEAVAGISAQSYSTSGGGEWTITIFATAFIVGRVSGKKKKKHKQVISNVSIPSTIFSKDVGALETISKYLKENLGMSYHKIAELLERDDRNIWTAYHKAIEKQKELIRVEETDIFFPISIFRKELTVLESVVLYMRKEGLRYSEISRLLHRDQRNIWSVYSKVMKKINIKL